MKKLLLLVLSLLSHLSPYSSFAEKCNKCGIDDKFIESLSNSYKLDLENNIKDISKDSSSSDSAKPTIIVFISSSIPISSLKNYALEAKNYNNIVFLMRGLVDSSFMRTKDFVLSFDGGVQIQEDAFNNYNISVVPTIVLAKEDKNGEITFDKVSGNISISSALEIFAQGGDMQLEAKSILNGKE